MNRTGIVIRQGEIKFSVGLLGIKRRDQLLDDWSLMEGEELLVGEKQPNSNSSKMQQEAISTPAAKKAEAK